MQICVYETYLRGNFISLFCVLRCVCECKLSVSSSNGQIVIAEQSRLGKEDNLEASRYGTTPCVSKSTGFVFSFRCLSQTFIVNKTGCSFEGNARQNPQRCTYTIHPQNYRPTPCFLAQFSWLKRISKHGSVYENEVKTCLWPIFISVLYVCMCVYVWTWGK